MKDIFPVELSKLEANAGSPIDLVRIQNEVLRQALEALKTTVEKQNMEVTKLHELLECRTAVMSPTKGFSIDTYQQRGECIKPFNNY